MSDPRKRRVHKLQGYALAALAIVGPMLFLIWFILTGPWAFGSG